MINYDILIPKTKEENCLDRLSETTKILIEKNKDFVKQLKKAGIEFNKYKGIQKGGL